MHRDPLPLLPPISRKFAGQILIGGLVVNIEKAAGDLRMGIDPKGKRWSVRMTHHYGEIEQARGADGDALDAYIGEDPEASEAYLIAQHDPTTGKYDEDKAFLGFNSLEEAVACYRNHNPNPGAMGTIFRLPVQQFAEAVYAGMVLGHRVDRDLIPGDFAGAPDPIQTITIPAVSIPPAAPSRIYVGKPAPAEYLVKGRRIFLSLRKAEGTGASTGSSTPGTAAGLAAVTPEDLEAMAAILKGGDPCPSHPPKG